MVQSTIAERHYEGGDLEALSDMPNYTKAILKPIRPYLRGRVIEVGAGIGNVANHYLDDAQHVLLVEPAENLYPTLVERFRGQSKVTTSCTLLHETDPALVSEPFDAAIVVNVLEHIENDRELLEQLHTLVRPGGMLLIFVPALPWLYGTLDSLVHHFRRYTHDGLRERVEEAGLSVDTLQYFDLLGIIPWFLAGKVFRRQQFDQSGAKAYDRFGVPFTRFFERQLSPPFGKSLLCMARKSLSAG